MVEKIRPSNSWTNVTATEPVKRLRRRKESKDPRSSLRDRGRKKKVPESEDDRLGDELDATEETQPRENSSGRALPAKRRKQRRGRKIDIRI